MMHLYDVPLAFALVGLVLYTVLAGADFGAGAWRLLAGRGGVLVERFNKPAAYGGAESLRYRVPLSPP